jgi:hypothetical protein
MSFSTNTRRKKSKASSDHPRKVATTTCFCALVQPERGEIGMNLLMDYEEAKDGHLSGLLH